MADINDIRAQLREIRHHPAAGGAHGNLTFYLVAGLAVTVGFGIVLFVPKIYSVQRTASLPAFHETISREAAVPPAKTLAAAAQPAGASNYTGKSAEEVAGVADAVCAQQNAGSGADSFAQQNEQLHCFLSEAPARFCSPSQSRKAAAEVINYFKGIENANAAAVIAARSTGRPAPVPVVEPAPPVATLVPDLRVVAAVEGLIKLGYLSRGQREEIGASVPPDIKHRLALVIANVSPCPKPPWWAVWK